MLTFAVWLTAAFGAVLLLLPGPSRLLFGWMLFGDPGRIDGFGPDALAYVTLLHGVLGAVMVGWAVALGGLLRRRTAPLRVIAASAGTWFVLDTAYSLWCGAWQNALLNSGFGLLFAAGLWGARSRHRS